MKFSQTSYRYNNACMYIRDAGIMPEVLRIFMGKRIEDYSLIKIDIL